MRRFLTALALVSLLLLILVVWISSRLSTAGHVPTHAGETTSVVARRIPTPRPALQTGASSIDQRTKTRGCLAQGPLPDAACTPGAVLTTDESAVCVPGYSASVRAVSASTKNAVYAEYGIVSHPTGAYEVDHLISLELGGSNGLANLWPEPAEPRPGFHEKDKVENALHQQVCGGRMSLADAQRVIASDWLSVYQSLPAS